MAKKKERINKEQAAKRIKTLQRQTWALDLKVKGLSYRRIARRMKELKLVPATYAEGMAYKDVQDAQALMVQERKELAEQNLYLDLRRYDELFEKAWGLALPQAEEGELDLPPDPMFFGIVMAILGRRETLLNYKSLWEKDKGGNVNLNTININGFSTAELLEVSQRIQSGEEPLIVLTEIQQRRSGQDKVSG